MNTAKRKDLIFFDI